MERPATLALMVPPATLALKARPALKALLARLVKIQWFLAPPARLAILGLLALPVCLRTSTS